MIKILKIWYVSHNSGLDPKPNDQRPHPKPEIQPNRKNSQQLILICLYTQPIKPRRSTTKVKRTGSRINKK